MKILLGLCVTSAFALAQACSASNFSGANKPADVQKTVGGTTAGGSDVGGSDSNVKVPVGAKKDVPGLGVDGKTDDGHTIKTCVSTDTAIATVDPKTCQVTGVKVGSTTLKVTMTDGTTKDVPVDVTPMGGSDAADAGDAGGGADTGAADSGGGGGGTGTGGDTGTGGTGTGGTDVDGGTGTTPKLTTEEGKLVAKLPGVEVIKVGVNFEDQGTHGDKDFNDAVLCFNGKFKVDNSNVVSIRNQTIVGTKFSHSGCFHTVRVEISHPDGSKEPSISFDSHDATPINMKFKVGSKLEVFMTATAASAAGCNPGVEKNMHTAVDAKVKPDLCNSSGD